MPHQTLRLWRHTRVQQFWKKGKNQIKVNIYSFEGNAVLLLKSEIEKIPQLVKILSMGLNEIIDLRMLK